MYPYAELISPNLDRIHAGSHVHAYTKTIILPKCHAHTMILKRHMYKNSRILSDTLSLAIKHTFTHTFTEEKQA